MDDPILAQKPDTLAEIPTDTSSVVQASAGTGKTFVLEHLIVELVLEEEISISNILVVTFTERATAELVERVRAIFQRLLDQTESDAKPDEPHWKLDAAKKRRLREALFSFDRAPIHTIHGFCHRILSEHAFSNQQPFEQELVEFDTLFDQAFHRALRQDFTASVARSLVLEAFVHEKSLSSLRSTLREAVRTSDAIEPTENFQAFEANLKDISAEISALGPMLAEMREVFDEVGAQGKINGNKEDKANRQLDGLIKAVEAFKKEGIEDFWRTLNAECDADNPFDYLANPSIFNKSHRDLYDESWVERLEELVDFNFEPLPLVLDEFVDLVEARLVEIKAEEGVFTYDDMLEYVDEAVQDSDELVQTLRDEYEFALVDEFQDTDSVQWEIFKRLFVDSGSHNPCTLIGDPKQAIYGFRGADVQTYYRAVQYVVKNAPVGTSVETQLPDNYRSTPELIDAYNTIFDPGEESSFFRTDNNNYAQAVGAGFDEKELLDGDGQEVAPVVVTQVEADGEEDEEVSSNGFQGAIFKSWSEEIARLTKEGRAPENELKIRETSDDDFETVEPSDIFVLTRSKRQGDDFAEYLREAGVPYAFYKREGLFETPEAHDWLELLRAVERPGSNSRRLKAWSTPFFEVGLGRAAEIRDAVDEDHPLVKRLETWHESAESGRIGQLVHRVLDDSGILRREIFKRHSERELTNYEHLGETFVDWAQTDDLSLADIISRLAQYVDGEGSPGGHEGDLQRLETDEQAVQIMTMHKAKGLSAPVVFIYGGFGRSWRGAQRYYEKEDPVLFFGSKTERSDPIEAYAVEEDERLLYVAMTRPEGRMYVPYANPEDRGDKLTRAKSPMGPLVERLDDIVGAETPSGFDIQRVYEDDSPPPSSAGPIEEESPRPAMDELTVDIESGLDVDDASFGKLRAHRRLFVESYKSVDSWSGHANESEQSNESLALDERAEPEDEPLMEDEPSGPPPGQTTGLCVHELFEDLDYRRVDEATDIDEWRSHPRVSRIVESTAARYGLEEFQEELEALVWRGLTSPVETKGVSIPSIAGTDRQSMELEFWYPIPGTSAATLEELVEAPDSKPRGRGDGYLRGFIDLVFEWDGRLYIADWKTDTRRGESAYTPADVESVVDERYSIQSTFYATAAARLVARSVTSRDAFEETFGGFMYLFARGMGPGEDGASPGVYFQQPDFDELIALEKRTGEMVSNKISKHRDYIAEGRYDRWR